jgi:uroporphyrinogen III methyltransferase/synthase
VAETNKTLHGKRVIVTRAVEQSETLVDALRSYGAVPVLLPMVSFAPPEDSEPLEAVLKNLRQFDWIFLTSQNALRAMQDRCAMMGLQLVEMSAAVSVAAVGPATAEAAEHAGLKIAYVAQKHQGVALAEELGERVRGKRVLLPRSDRANRDLVEVLDHLGARVTEVIAYKTIRPNEAETKKHLSEIEKGADAVLFFSPSSVHHLRDTLGAARFVILSREIAFTAIGSVTERALRAAGVERVIASKDTHVTAVVDALTDFFSTSEQKLSVGAKRG